MRQSGDKTHRTRASFIVVDMENDRVIFMYRLSNAKEKYILPGGGVEDGETLEQCAVREVKEEMNIDIIINKKLTTIEYPRCSDHVFLSTQFSGIPELGGEELARISDDNIYHPEWVSLTGLETSKIPIYPGEIIALIKKEISTINN